MRSSHLSALVSAVLLFPALTLTAPPALADPSDPSVTVREQKKTVDELYVEAEAAGERAHELRVEADEVQAELTSLQADLERQNQATEAARGTARDIIIDQYTSGAGLDEFASIVSAGGPAEFVEQVNTREMLNDFLNSQISDYDTELKALAIRADAVAASTERLTAIASEAESEAVAAQALYDEAKATLGTLQAEREAARKEAAEREAEVLARMSIAPTAPTAPNEDTVDIPATGRAKEVLAFAYSQLGDAYVYGAAGPDAWDCSGFTMMAWGAAGISLPHSSRVQSGMGIPVAFGDLKPGDLVFYYSPVSHVAIYAGDGMVIHAANPGSGVTTAPVSSMPFSGARRVG